MDYVGLRIDSVFPHPLLNTISGLLSNSDKSFGVVIRSNSREIFQEMVYFQSTPPSRFGDSKLRTAQPILRQMVLKSQRDELKYSPVSNLMEKHRMVHLKSESDGVRFGRRIIYRKT